ncbi:UNVERIFIED_CONTAM: hypothetical protein Slati_0993000 [Sesamum latifolium]|uniref:Transposase MuDR plant domain-containing protein n=1 Tax=Sesamum latifolium TaxID=2727402 RepID=A0AAW2XQX7_9LAMI
MVMKRPDRHLHLPPPLYHPESDSITLCIYYGGEARHIPEAVYVGGNVCKLDYVMPKHCCLETLNAFSDNIGIARVDEGNAGGEGISVDEGDDVVGEGNAGGEGDPVDEGDDAVGEENAEEDKNEEEGRGEERGRVEDQIVEDTSDSSEDDGEEDVVENDGDLDEGRDSEGEGPSNPIFNPEETYDPTFEIGCYLVIKKEFKKALQSYAIKSKRTVKFTKNDKIRVYAQCGDSECGWKMHAIKIKGEETFQINLLQSHHSCPEMFEAYRAKKAALKEIEGSPEWQYSRLWDYADEIRATNSGSTVIIGTDQQMREERFNRFYVCFGALKRGFNAVVNKEYRETWEWFLIVLKHDLNIVRDYEFTFMSDKQKGLMQAFEEVFPGSDHRCCVRHLHNNFKHAGFRGQGFKIALWNAAKTCTVVQWSRSHFSEGGAAEDSQPHGPGKQSETEQPTILPPSQVSTGDEYCPEACLTQDEVHSQAPSAPVYMPGPSMYQQLTMSNPQPRIQIRAPPPFRGRQYCHFFYTSRAQSGNIHPIVIEGGKKFLDLSQFKK